MMRASWLGHFLNSCATPNSVEEYVIKLTDFHKKVPSLTEFLKVSDDKPGYFFKWPKRAKFEFSFFSEAILTSSLFNDTDYRLS